MRRKTAEKLVQLIENTIDNLIRDESLEWLNEYNDWKKRIQNKLDKW